MFANFIIHIFRAHFSIILFRTEITSVFVQSRNKSNTILKNEPKLVFLDQYFQTAVLFVHGTDYLLAQDHNEIICDEISDGEKVRRQLANWPSPRKQRKSRRSYSNTKVIALTTCFEHNHPDYRKQLIHQCQRGIQL